jgi:hypothetical protein
MLNVKVVIWFLLGKKRSNQESLETRKQSGTKEALFFFLSNMHIQGRSVATHRYLQV